MPMPSNDGSTLAASTPTRPQPSRQATTRARCFASPPRRVPQAWWTTRQHAEGEVGRQQADGQPRQQCAGGDLRMEQRGEARADDDRGDRRHPPRAARRPGEDRVDGPADERVERRVERAGGEQHDAERGQRHAEMGRVVGSAARRTAATQGTRAEDPARHSANRPSAHAGNSVGRGAVPTWPRRAALTNRLRSIAGARRGSDVVAASQMPKNKRANAGSATDDVGRPLWKKRVASPGTWRPVRRSPGATSGKARAIAASQSRAWSSSRLPARRISTIERCAIAAPPSLRAYWSSSAKAWRAEALRSETGAGPQARLVDRQAEVAHRAATQQAHGRHDRRRLRSARARDRRRRVVAGARLVGGEHLHRERQRRRRRSRAATRTLRYSWCSAFSRAAA